MSVEDILVRIKNIGEDPELLGQLEGGATMLEGMEGYWKQHPQAGEIRAKLDHNKSVARAARIFRNSNPLDN